MKLKNIVSGFGIVLLLAGCVSISQQRATVADGTIQNSAFGFSGYTFKIPDGFTVYSPDATPPAEYNELQRMAIRIYNLNNDYHPRGNELFYESFLLMSEQSCFLLAMLKYDYMEPVYETSYGSSISAPMVMQGQLLPLYNTRENHTFELSGTHLPAVYTCGSAYEQKGWYYADQKRNSMPFNYEACKITGSKNDSFILMGFALPEHADVLAVPMKQMIDGLKM